MSVKLMRQVWNIPLKPTQKLVLLALADHANDEGVCWPSRETISDKTGLTPKGVTDAINALRTASLVTIKKLKGNRNEYAISSNLELLPVVTVGVHSSNRGCPLVVTDSVLSSNRGLLPIYRTTKEPPVLTTNEHISAPEVAECDDANILTDILPEPVDEWKASNYGFDEFYKAYPKKAGRQNALKNWLKLKPSRALLDQILQDIRDRLSSGMWQLSKKKFIKDPERYISGRQWEDEIIAEPGVKTYSPTEREGFIKYDPDKAQTLTEEKRLAHQKMMEGVDY